MISGPLSQSPRLARRQLEVNVIGLKLVTAAMLPVLRRSVADSPGVMVEDAASIVNITSVAAYTPYEQGGGYNAAKFAEVAINDALRLELNGKPVRVCDIAPGLVESDEFALVRFDGDAERAKKVYEGVDRPLTQDDIAECVAWVAELPHHVNIDKLTVKPVAQAAPYKMHRGPIYG